MCDYCDCRAIPEIGGLSDEHERVLAVTHRLKRRLRADPDSDDGSVTGLLAELRNLLEPHTRREEIGIFAVLAHIDCEPMYRTHFLDDHVDIDRALAGDDMDRAEISALVELVERHIFEEETDLYPALRQLFSPADWTAVEHRLRQLATDQPIGATRLLPSSP